MSIRSKLLITAVAASVSAIAAPAFAAEATTFGEYGEVPAALQQSTSQFSRDSMRSDAPSSGQSIANVWLPDAQQYLGTSERSRAQVRAEGRSLTAQDYTRNQAWTYSAEHI